MVAPRDSEARAPYGDVAPPLGPEDELRDEATEERIKELAELSDEELEMARLQLEARVMNLHYFEDRGFLDIVEPEHVPVETELNEEIDDIVFVQRLRHYHARGDL